MAFRFETLEIWKDALVYTRKIYLLTKQFPREELFSIVDQLRRAANSIAANIAKGSGSSSKKDFCHYLDIAIQSAYETVSHLYLAKELEYISEETRKEFYINAEVLVKKIQAFKVYLNKS